MASPPRKARIHALDHFRGAAILIIVLSHCIHPSWNVDSLTEKTVANIIINCSALFVFISGFFFHHIYADRFRFGRFLRGKLRTVFSPYITLSLTVFLLHLAVHRPLPMASELGYQLDFEHPLRTWLGHARMAFVYILTGKISGPYWFMPFIGFMFLLSPVFLLFSRSRPSIKIFYLLASVALASWLQRPLNNFNTLHSVLYFAPFYALGITYSVHRARINDWLRGKDWAFALLVLALAALQAKIVPFFGGYTKTSMWVWNGIDINVFQKVAFCLFLITFCNRLGDREIPVLRFFASASFALYLLHYFALDIFRWPKIDHLISFARGFYGSLFLCVTAIGLCLTFASLFRLALGRHSRYVIGW
ncbi:MAG: acyltransferase [Synechococcaceae cyanobacterium]|nr:acyltransferase [Synechococcaceae cyanobacterium]